MTDKTLGSHERHESPDYMDGGVTAAAVEAEALSGASLAAHFRDKRDMERARAEKAEKERDEARATMEEYRSLATRYAAESRPLTPDAITDEMIKRALKADGEDDRFTTTIQGHRMRHLLGAALAGPAPEWSNAPAVLAVCNDSMDRAVFVRHGDGWWKSEHYSCATWGLRQVTPLYPKEITGHSAERGVRVVGEEQP